MMSMETSSQSTVTEMAGVKVEYGKLAALNPEDLKKKESNAPASKQQHQTHFNTEEHLSVSEVMSELKMKMKDGIMTSSVDSILLGMRISNLTIASLMILIGVTKIITSDSFWSVLQDVFSVFYTFFFAGVLIGYELRTSTVDVWLRDRFGFMYHPLGRLIFLFLISIFPLSMVGVYGVIVAGLGWANAYFNYFVITKHPSFTRGVPDYTPPASDNSMAASV